MTLKNIFGDISLDSSLSEIKQLLVAILKPLSQVTGSGSSRLSVDVNNIIGGTLPTVTTVTTVGTVSNQTNVGGVSAFELQKAASHSAFVLSIRPYMT